MSRITRVARRLGVPLLLAASTRPCLAQVVVTALKTPRPAIAGRFATVECAIVNRGAALAPAKAVAVGALASDGRWTPFSVTPPNPPLAGGLKAGQAYTFRQFERSQTPGDLTCEARLQAPDGKWTPLALVDGRPARAIIRFVPEASAPRVQFQVTDPQPRHVYRAGDTIRVSVLPVFTGGADLTGEVASLSVSAPVKPFAMPDEAKAREVLLKGAGGDVGYVVDFWGAPDDRKRLDVRVQFARPVTLTSLTLSGMDLNGEYSLKGCEAESIGADGAAAPIRTIVLAENNRWTVRSAMRAAVVAKELRVHLTTPYKLNLTGLNLQGSASADQKPVGGAAATYWWQDAFGRRLTRPARLALFEPNAVASPAGLKPGYYGLVLAASFPDADPTQREYGFPVLESLAPRKATDPRLGMVHADIADPYLGFGGVKTMLAAFYDSAARKLDANAWQSAMNERAALGRTELPIVNDPDWWSDSTKPVAGEQLVRLRAKMEQYFRATPDLPAWEFGIEENLGYRGNRSTWTSHWTNLAAKGKAVREAARAAGSNVKLVYQIAELDFQSVDEFLRSGAGKEFDVLALHPYAWPDFPAPEKWMPEYIGKVRDSMRRSNTNLRIWFTEIGAPDNGNPGGFFGYPSIPVHDRGLSRDEYAAYMVKCYLVGMRQGVEQIYWYNYRDGGSDPEYAEHHFAVVDYAGYPKPGYVAYSVMADRLRGRTLEPAGRAPNGVQAYRFRGERQDCLVVWTYPAANRTVSLAALGLRAAKVTSVTDLMGTPIPRPAASLPLSANPVYVTVDR